LSRIVRWLLIALLAVLVLGGVYLWWILFHNRLWDGADLATAHSGELREIQRIYAANPALCGVGLSQWGRGPCPAAKSARARAGYARVLELMDAVGIETLQADYDEHGRLTEIDAWIYSEGLLPSTPPIAVRWDAPPGEAVPSFCHAFGLADWHVCEGKWIFL
jgi:hypothetical protein